MTHSDARSSGFFRMIRLVTAASFLVALPLSPTEAQECEVSDITTPDANATQLAQANFTCVVARLTATVSRLETLEAELGAFRKAKGAVLAFDRDRNEERVCPEGWDYFGPAGGRFVVGAGEHDNTLTEYHSFSEDENQSVGGSESITLVEDNLPEHSHLLAMATAEEQYRAEQGTPFKPSLVNKDGPFGGRMFVTGGPRNLTVSRERTPALVPNMPPFVALYFCKQSEKAQ